MIDASRPDSLARIGRSDLFHRAYEIEPGARWEYRLQVDFEPWIADPQNPDSVPAPWGNPRSVVATPGRVESTGYLPSSAGPRGRLEALAYASAALGNTRELQVWLPPGYDGGTEAHPLLIVHQGPDWLEKGGLAHTLDNRSGRSFRAPIAVFVPPLEEWWFEGGGTGTEEYVDALAAELVPFLAARYRVSSGPGAHALLGKESFGLTAILGALRHPETFGKAGVLSFALGDRARHTLFELLAREPRAPLRFFVGWNRYALRNRDGGFDYRAESALIADALRKAGHEVTGGEAMDSCGWGSWRTRVEELLGALLPVE
jgi:enterochelin esterase family protein